MLINVKLNVKNFGNADTLSSFPLLNFSLEKKVKTTINKLCIFLVFSSDIDKPLKTKGLSRVYDCIFTSSSLPDNLKFVPNKKIREQLNSDKDIFSLNNIVSTILLV